MADRDQPAAHTPSRKVVEFEPPLAGYMVAETIRRVYLPAILNTNEGNGDVGRLLANLQDTHDEVIVTDVLSPRLAGMLQRRGYHRELHWAPDHQEHVECYVYRPPTPDTTVAKDAAGATPVVPSTTWPTTQPPLKTAAEQRTDAKTASP